MRFSVDHAFTRRHARVLLLVSVLALQAASAPQPYQPSPLPDRVILNWTEDPSTGFSVTWRTDTTVDRASAEIVPAEDGPGFAKKAQRIKASTEAYETDRGRAHSHFVTFHGLTPAALYLYRVGDGENWTEWNQFRTAAPKPEPLAFIYFGDVQTHIHSVWSRVVRQAYSMAPDARFMVYAGDLINRHALDHEWGEWHRAAGWINRVVPSFPAVGNHEYGSSGGGGRKLTPNWRPQFTLPANGVAGLEDTNYYIDIQGLRMIALNSNLKQKEQAEWLDRLLQNNPNRWTVVAFHHPIYSTKRGRDNPELRRMWQPVFDKHGVDLVLQGHDHTYGRTNLQTGGKVQSGKAGTVYVVSMSGAKMYDLGDLKVFARVAEDTQLFQIVRIQGDTLRFETRTASGTLYDAFTLRKQAGKPNKLTNQIPATPARVRASGR
jgi:hypothetical protein